MKKILILFVFASLAFTSCQTKERMEIEFTSNTHELLSDTVEVELNTVLNVNVATYSNVNQRYDSYPYWNKFGENTARLANSRYTTLLEIADNDGWYYYHTINFPISDSLYQSGDHYVLTILFEGGYAIDGNELHVIVK